VSGLSFPVAAYVAVALETVDGHDVGMALAWLLAGPFPFYVTGLAAYWRAPTYPISTLLLGLGGMFGLGTAIEYVVKAAAAAGAADGWLVAGVWANGLTGLVGIVLLARTLALMPDGRCRYGYERVVLRAAWATPLLSLLVLFAGPTAYLDNASYFESFPRVATGLPTVEWLAGPVGFAYRYHWVMVVLGMVLFVARAVRMEPEERRKLRAVFVVLTLIAVEVIALVLGYLWFAQPAPATQLLSGFYGMLPFVAILGAVVVAGVQSRNLPLSLVVKRTLVYGLLWILIAGLYVGLASALGLAATARLPLGVAVVLTVAATVVLEPVRRWVNRLAERRVFGRRLSGYELLVRLGGTLEHAFRPRELADELAGGLRDGLGLSWAQVSVDGYVGSAGTVSGDAAVERPVRHGEVSLGEIRCGPKLAGAFLPRDLELVETLARQAALALHNARQAAELEASRARIVQAQDAERRRIERDLHDGVQQEVVALVAKLGLARSSLNRDAAQAGELLDEVRGEALRIVEDLRELAHGIHPSVLTDEGLAAAVESTARRMPIPVAVSADSVRSARFPVEVEESAYYFVSESLTNVLKHSRASRVAIDLVASNGSLVVDVRDNGTGLPPDVEAGAGLTALRDRIEAVGGTLSVGNDSGGGAALSAVLPSGQGDS
jgi:signal transduction histidine kinase